MKNAVIVGESERMNPTTLKKSTMTIIRDAVTAFQRDQHHRPLPPDYRPHLHLQKMMDVAHVLETRKGGPLIAPAMPVMSLMMV